MPDSFPPLTWGPQPFDERDLDALLSGHMADTPQALRQVADALTALRAAPTPAELSGEAVARAEFRDLVLDEAVRTDGHPYGPVLSALTLDGPGRPPARHRIGRVARVARVVRGTRVAGPDRTDRPGPPGGPARPDRAHPPGRRPGRRGSVVIAAGAAALIVTVVVLSSGLSSPSQQSGQKSAAAASSSTHSSGGRPASQNVQDGTATPDPSHQGTPAQSPRQTPSSSPASSPPSKAGTLCDEYYSDVLLPQSPRLWSAESSLYWQIAKLAGSRFPSRVNSFCSQYVRQMFQHGLPGSLPGQPGAQGGPPERGEPGQQPARSGQ